MKVFFKSNPQAMMSLAFCRAYLCVSSNESLSLKSAFSSSCPVNYSPALPERILTCKHNNCTKLVLNVTYKISITIPKGTSNTSCNHFVKENGIVWPRCKASLDGPRPVYRKNGSPCSYLSRMRSKSRWEKNRPRRSQRCGLWPVRRSKRWRSSSSINLVAHFLLS